MIDSGGKAKLWSRNHLPLEPKFPSIEEALNRMAVRLTILGGEIAALDDQGIPGF
jgi:ATP-dependent DNA ligase